MQTSEAVAAPASRGERFSRRAYRQLRRRAATATLALTVVTTAAAASLASPAPAFASPSGDLAAATNSARAAAGLPALKVDASLSAVAQTWANHLAATNVLAHNPALRDQVTNWNVLGENVGMAGDIPSVQQAFMNSAPHRANILDPRYTQMGVGAATSTYPQCSCTVLWVVVDFRLPASAPAPTPTAAPAPAQPKSAASAPAAPATRSGTPVSAPHSAPAPATSGPTSTPTAKASATALGSQLVAAAASPSPTTAVTGDPVSRLLRFASLMSNLPG